MHSNDQMNFLPHIGEVVKILNRNHLPIIAVLATNFFWHFGVVCKQIMKKHGPSLENERFSHLQRKHM